MEPALIYAASDQLISQLKWVRVAADTEWIYIGNGEEINEEVVIRKIKEIFIEPDVVIAIDRQQSFNTTIDQVLPALKGILGFRNFIIWNKSFKHALQFSDIGVMRYGTI